MGKLIVSDLKKLVKCRTVWVCAVISFLVGMLMTFLYDMAWNNMADTQNYQTVFYFMRTMGMDSDKTGAFTVSFTGFLAVCEYSAF